MDYKVYAKPIIVVAIAIAAIYYLFDQRLTALNAAKQKQQQAEKLQADATRTLLGNKQELDEWNRTQEPMQKFLAAWDKDGKLKAIEADELLSRLSSLAVAEKLVASDPGMRRVDNYTFERAGFPVSSVSMRFTGTLPRQLSLLGNIQFEFPHCRIENLAIAPSSDANVAMTVVVTVPKELTGTKKEGVN